MTLTVKSKSAMDIAGTLRLGVGPGSVPEGDEHEQWPVGVKDGIRKYIRKKYARR